MLPSFYTLIQVLAVEGSIKQLKAAPHSTRVTAHTVFVPGKTVPVPTLRTLLVQWTNLVSMLKIESFFLSLHSFHGKLLSAIYVTEAPQVEAKGLVHLWL